MACEARILRVLRTMDFPGLADDSCSATTALSLAARPENLSKIVSWIEDTKVGLRVMRGATKAMSTGMLPVLQA